MAATAPQQNLLQDCLAKLDRGNAPDSKYPDSKGEYWALCPYHADTQATNFSVSDRGFKCFACGQQGGLGDLAKKLGVAVLQGCSGGNKPPLPPLTLDEYARAKHLPEDFLESLGLQTVHLQGKAAIKIPYYDVGGVELAVRFRLALPKTQGKGPDNRFRWRTGSKLHPYGLQKLSEAQAAGYVIVVEGESDSHTLWYHNLAALGVPGAQNWKPEWAKYLDGLDVYVWQEPDKAGQEFVQKIGKSLPELRIIRASAGRKDISECHLLGDDIPTLIQTLKASSQAFSLIQANELAKQAAVMHTRALPLLQAYNILDLLGQQCSEGGLIGEDRNAKLLYLAVTSRLLEKVISIVVKGPSSAGKSHLVDVVLRFFPEQAYYALSSMSERALAYSEEPLVHRMLVLYEAAGMTSDFGTYLMRTLLSEGRIRYETVEKTQDGLKPKLIEREGPTGMIVTTTWANLHPENETRMFSLTVRDDPDQTKAVMACLANRANGQTPKDPDYKPWHALQTWLELASVKQVSIPYAHELAEMSSSKAVRLRRDFGAILNLIRTHAVLYQEQRQRDLAGRIIATIADYAAIYDLTVDLLGEGVEATVGKGIRETVNVVAAHSNGGTLPLSVTQVAQFLKLDKSAASRRVKVAVGLGYLVNLEDKKGRPAKLIPSIDPLPKDELVMPTPDDLTQRVGGGGSSSPVNNAATAQQSSIPVDVEELEEAVI